jgi:hypothetical protein
MAAEVHHNNTPKFEIIPINGETFVIELGSLMNL